MVTTLPAQKFGTPTEKFPRKFGKVGETLELINLSKSALVNGKE